MIEIFLTRGKTTIIDDEDYVLVKKHKWFAKKDYHTYGTEKFYANTRIVVEGKPKIIQMHRIILGAEEGQLVDHKNGDGLDNRRENLRFASYSDNARNKASIGVSSYKGVYWKKKNCKWCSQIWTGDKKIHLGLFDYEEDAAKAYNKAAQEYFGEFARLNEFST